MLNAPTLVAPAGPSAASAAGDRTVNPYDAVPYSVHAFPQTQPDRLAVIARLFGMEPAPPERCRVLELGCASGGNLIAMAVASPDSQFVGIDLSRRQIDEGCAVVRELGLGNVELDARSILDVGRDLGTFDYILCHGVYSWVPAAVQDRILDICRRNLTPDGVAYVSYNTYPGWHARRAVREMLCYHTERFDAPADRVREARALLDFLAAAMSRHDAGGGFGALLREELTLLQAAGDAYVLHEHLEDVNEPLYFHQFTARAGANGLQYLGEAQVSAMVSSTFGAATERTLRQISPDLLHLEQYMDFVRNRMFRQTLLCHADVALDHALRPEAVYDFRISSPARAVSSSPDLSAEHPEQFRVNDDGPALTTRDPLMKAAMLHLAEQWPMPVTFADLLAAARQRLRQDTAPASCAPRNTSPRELAARLLHCYTSSLVEFSLAPPAFVATVTERPVASPYARLRARAGATVTSLRMESVELSEPARLALQHLDGRHDRADVAALVCDWLERSSYDLPPGAAAERAERYVEELLDGCARSALLVA